METFDRKESDRKYREAHRNEILLRARAWAEKSRRARGVPVRNIAKIKEAPVDHLHKKVWEMKDLGMNSYEVSSSLNKKLSIINKMFSTSPHDPENRKMWLRYETADKMANPQ